MPYRVYLDSCVVSRAADDQTQERIRLEASAIAHILDAVSDREIEWIASPVLTLELGRNPDPQKRADALVLLSLASSFFVPTGETLTRSQQLRLQGYGPIDSLHLAVAEQARVSTLLTVDDRFLRLAGTRPQGAMPTVENPVDWWRRRQPWLIKR